MPGTIVVVDDEPEILDLLCVLLREEGYSVVCFGDPAKVPALPQELHPVLFLLDLMLPVMNGMELARLLRGDQHETTPMIAMSASTRLLSEARKSGLFDSTLDKPFEVAELLKLAERYAA